MQSHWKLRLQHMKLGEHNALHGTEWVHTRPLNPLWLVPSCLELLQALTISWCLHHCQHHTPLHTYHQQVVVLFPGRLPQVSLPVALASQVSSMTKEEEASGFLQHQGRGGSTRPELKFFSGWSPQPEQNLLLLSCLFEHLAEPLKVTKSSAGAHAVHEIKSFILCLWSIYCL